MEPIIVTGKEWAKAVLPDPVLRWLQARRQVWFARRTRARDRQVFINHLRADDVFVVGHPKSGNTWVAYMLALLSYPDRQDQVTLSNIEAYIPLIPGESDSRISNYPDLPRPRIFRNEVPRYPELYPKTIYLIRDPRAALTSYYHMYRTLFNDHQTSLHAFVEEYLAQGCIRRWEPVPRWDVQVLEWLKRARQPERVLILKYEDMLTDRRAALEKMARFARLDCRPEVLDVAVARGAFSSMQKDEAQHGVYAYPGEIAQRGRFVRSGKSDSWRSEMEARTVQRIEAEFAPAMRACGYA